MTKTTNKCPRCNKNTMRDVEVHNSLSRRGNVYICSQCGIEEAMIDYTDYQLRTGQGFHPVGLDVITRESLFLQKLGIEK